MIQRRYDEVRRIGRFSEGAILATLKFVIPRLNDPVPPMDGFGIVTVGGGSYLKYVWAQVKKTRELTDAPIICYHIGPEEIDHPATELLMDLGVEFRDAVPIMQEQNYQSRHGWCAKSAGLLDCPFRYALFLDSDCYPLIEPESVLNHPDFSHGFLAFNDINTCRKNNMVFPLMGLSKPDNFREWEAGAQLWDRRTQWKALQLFSWMNGRPRPFHDIVWGDKDLAPLAHMKLGMPFKVGGDPKWMGYGILHTLSDGTPAFMHSMTEKRSGDVDPAIADLLHEFNQLSLQPA